MYRFSTKYHDDGAGLVYYGYRYYSAELGRWLNRDPFGEEGGINLYAMVMNDPVNIFDPYGLMGLAKRTEESVKRKIRYQIRIQLSFIDLLGKEGWECRFKKINSYKDCNCGSNQDQMLIVHEKIEETEKNPWTDHRFPWIPRGPDGLHAIRLEVGDRLHTEVVAHKDGIAHFLKTYGLKSQRIRSLENSSCYVVARVGSVKAKGISISVLNRYWFWKSPNQKSHFKIVEG